MNPGDYVLLDGALVVKLVRYIDTVSAVIELGGGTQVVPVVALSKRE